MSLPPDGMLKEPEKLCPTIKVLTGEEAACPKKCPFEVCIDYIFSDAVDEISPKVITELSGALNKYYKGLKDEERL